MPDELDALGLVLYHVGSDGWVMGDLFDKEVCASTVVNIWPVAIEESVRIVRTKIVGGVWGTYSPKTGLRGLVGLQSEMDRYRVGFERTFSRNPWIRYGRCIGL